jgi:hypothetical protein
MWVLHMICFFVLGLLCGDMDTRFPLPPCFLSEISDDQVASEIVFLLFSHYKSDKS